MYLEIESGDLIFIYTCIEFYLKQEVRKAKLLLYLPLGTFCRPDNTNNYTVGNPETL